MRLKDGFSEEVTFEISVDAAAEKWGNTQAEKAWRNGS